MTETAFEDLPPALMLLGPGAWEAAEQLYGRHESSCSVRVEKLDAISARHVVGQAYIRPFGQARVKVFVICLDGATDTAQNILLKVLEEPPDTVRFVLASRTPPLATITSRCQVLVRGGGEAGPEPADAKARQMVVTAVRAARDHQAPLLDAAMAGWDDGHTAVLRAWAAERAADRWVGFRADFIDRVSVRQAMTILATLEAYSGARTAPRVALDKAFKR